MAVVLQGLEIDIVAPAGLPPVESDQVTETVLWSRENPFPFPAGRTEHAISYDSQSDRTILFGGYTGQPNGETWAYDVDGNSWVNMTPAVGPTPRNFVAMAYDTESDRLVLFGGFQGGTRSDDTWAYDLEANTWRYLVPFGRPLARTGSAMTYDSESDRIILFGGYSAELSAETWAYDYNTNVWNRMDPPVAPPARGLHSLVYDAESDRAIMFGGSIEIPGEGITLYRDTWAYDFNANRWTAMSPANPPSARAWHGMAYDAGSDRVILFGGLDANGPSNETWSYDFNQNRWSRLATINRPSDRTGLAMAYDTESGRVVLFGGRTGLGLSSETWIMSPAPPDTTSPSVTIVSPPHGAILDSSTVIVRGTASDDRGIERLEVSADGSNWVSATGTTSWSAVITAAIGQNTIYARVTDTSGNTAFATNGVTVLPTLLLVLPAVLVALVVLGVWVRRRIRRARAHDPTSRFRPRRFRWLTGRKRPKAPG